MGGFREQAVVACRPIDAIEIMGTTPADWLVPFFHIASLEAERAGRLRRSKLGLDDALPGERLVLIDTSEPEQLPGGAVSVSFVWRTAGYATVFSSMRGRVLAWAEDDESAGLAAEGEAGDEALRRSDGAQGRVFDHAARAALRNLVENLKAALEELVRSSR